MTHADDLVARYILDQYRDERRYRKGHLAECPDVTVEHPEAEDGMYGCDTGCPYVTFSATLRCPHGGSEDFEYGTFGELAYLIEDLDRQDGRS